MRLWGLLAVVALGSGCIIEPPDLIRLDGGDFYADGGGGTSVNINLDGGINWDGQLPNWDGGLSLGGDGGLNFGDGGLNFGDGGTKGWDAGVPPQATFPGSGGGGDPGLGVLWLVRVDRGLANLAAPYATLIQTLTQQLAGQGFDVRMTAVGDLYGNGYQLFWSGEGKTLAVDSLQSILESIASTSSGVSSVCSSDALSAIGFQLSQLNVNQFGSTLSFRPFQGPRGALLVVLLDHGARPVAYGSSCSEAGVSPAEHFGAGHAATNWLNLNSGSFNWNLPRSQTRFLFVSTSETESYAQMRERCAAMSAFPRTALDSLSPSPQPFYGPFSSALGNYQGELGTQVDLCDAVARDWAGTSRGFARSWSALLSLPASQR